MSDDLKSKRVLIYDYGLFVSLAETLARYFGEVRYFMPWKSSFPKSNSLIVGAGLTSVTRTTDFFDEIDSADLIVFPDVYDGDLQNHLRSIGHRVWGGGKGEEMELKRWEMKQLMERIGLPVQKVWRIEGLDTLREFLQKQNDVFVKVSTTRGDFETFHHETYQLSEPRLDELEHKLGAKKHILTFIVEDAINDATEVGYDGWTIDGQFPQQDALIGIEIKDAGYAGAIMPYKALPESVRNVNAKLAPIMRDYGYRGFFSSEIRLNGDKKPYLIDPCCRCGSPPSELYQEMYDNFGEIIWNGAAGKLVEPHATSKYGVLAMIHSAWADKNWQALHFPPAISRWVKLRNKTVIDGTVYVVPTDVGLPEIGAVIGVGETLLDAIKHLAENASQIKGHSIEIKLDAIPQAMKAFAEAEKDHKMKFGDGPIPSTGEVAELLAL